MTDRIKVLTIIYIFLMVGIIALANLKSTEYLLSFVGDIPYGDKIGHFVLFGILSFLVNLSFGMKIFRRGKFGFPAGSLLVLLAITLQEFSQLFLSGRTFSLVDLLCGFLGVILGGTTARFVFKKAQCA